MEFCFREISCLLLSALTPLLALDWQDEVKSEAAAKLLDEVIELYEDFDGERPSTKAEVAERLGDLLVINGQFDDAERIAETMSEWKRNEILARINRLKLEQLAAQEELRPENIDNIKRLTSHSGYRMSFAGDSLQKLLVRGETNTVMEIIDSIDSDMQTYKYRSGMFDNGYTKMLLLSRVAAHLLRTGKSHEANRIFDRFGEPVTRDQARRLVVEMNLYRENRNLEFAERAFTDIEDTEKRYWMAYKLGIQFAKDKNHRKALKYGEIVKQLSTSVSPSLRRYEANLYLRLAQLKMEEVRDPSKWIGQARQVAGNDRNMLADVLAMEVLDGNLKTINQNPWVAIGAVSRLVSADDKYFTDHESALKLIERNQRTEAAKRIIDELDNPLLRARALTDFVRRQREMDAEEAIPLLDEAYQAAREGSEPYFLSETMSINQAEVLQNLASLYARLGQLEKAMQVVERVPDEPEDGPRSFGPETYTKRERALEDIGRHLPEKLESLNTGTKTAFRVIESLQKYESKKANRILNRLLGKMVAQGNWSGAEQAYKKAREEWDGPVDAPYSVMSEIAKTNDYKGLRNWFELCGEENQSKFIGHLCSYFNWNNKVPSSRMVIEVEGILDDNRIERTTKSVLNFLIVGLWADGFEDRAKGYVDQLAKQKSGDYLMLQLAAQSIESDLPKLGFYVAGKRTVSNSHMLNGYHRTSERYIKLVNDEEWMGQQSPLIQMVMKMSRAYRLIDDLEQNKPNSNN